MKQRCLFIMICLLSSLISYAASSSQGRREVYRSDWSVMHGPLAGLIQQFKTDLPSQEEARSLLNNLTEQYAWGKQLLKTAEDLKHPEDENPLPASILLACSSERDAQCTLKAIAAYTEVPYVYLQSKDIAAGYKDAEDNLLLNLLKRLALHKKHTFLILIDNISVESAHLENDLAYALEGEHKIPNVCLIATRYMPSENLQTSLGQSYNPALHNLPQAVIIHTPKEHQKSVALPTFDTNFYQHTPEPHIRHQENSNAFILPIALSVGAIVTAAIFIIKESKK